MIRKTYLSKTKDYEERDFELDKYETMHLARSIDRMKDNTDLVL